MVAPPPASGQTTIDSPGRWSLERLGYGGAKVVALDARGGPDRLASGKVAFRYRLPAAARQGEPLWYLIRLHAQVTFSPGGGAGIAYLTGATNRRAASQVKFEIPAGSGGPVRFSTVDLVEGLRKRSSDARQVEVRNENFLQDRGVRANTSILTFALDQLRSARVRSVRILPDSGIVLSRAGPAPLALSAVVTPARAKAGESFEVRATIRNPGRRPARQVGVTADFDRAAARLKGDASRPLPDIPPGGRETQEFEFEARRPGSTRVAVGADSASASKAAATTIPIAEADELSALERIARVAILAIVFVPAVLVVLLPRLRRRRRQP